MVKLNLGCSDKIMDGYVNVDIAEAPGVTVADLRQPWPWAPQTVEKVLAHDIIEHLPDKIFTMNELWRVLRDRGLAEIIVPTTEGPGAWQDPTHTSFWNRHSFWYFEQGNPYRERFHVAYGIRARFIVVSEKLQLTVDGPKLAIVLAALH